MPYPARDARGRIRQLPATVAVIMGSFTWMLPAVGVRSLRCFAIRSLGIRRCQPRNGDTITNAISSQRRERSYTPVAGASCCIALLTMVSFTWILPAVGARSFMCFAIRSLGIRRCRPRNGDTITNAISIQSLEGTSRHRVIGTWYDITIICQTTWRMILLHPLDATH